MSVKHQKRFTLLAVIGLGVALAVGLILFALKQNINLFFTPTQIQAGEVTLGQNIRLGGMVVEGSFQRGEGLHVSFALTDFENVVQVHYEGILPDLFREGQGIVTEGKLTESGFVAHQVLAKHDENYMPKEIRDTLKRDV